MTSSSGRPELLMAFGWHHADCRCGLRVAATEARRRCEASSDENAETGDERNSGDSEANLQDLLVIE
jgi:hypothetical protein